MDRIKIMADRRWQIDNMSSGRLWADRNLLSQVVDGWPQTLCSPLTIVTLFHWVLPGQNHRPPTPRLGTSRIPRQPSSSGWLIQGAVSVLRIKNGFSTHLPRSECLANVWEEGWDWPSSKL